MSNSDPYVVEFPADTCTSDDVWRIEFHTAGSLHWINNVPEQLAQWVYRWWQETGSGRLICCRQCPPSTNSDCPHDELPEQRGWGAAEMYQLRVMPMREAV